MFWFFTRKRWFYDPDKCEAIISRFTGTREMQTLRALSDGSLKVTDIKNFYAYGRAGYGYPPDEEYKLICHISDKAKDCCKIVRYDSGLDRSMLSEVELIVTDGAGVVKQFWTSM